MRLFFLFVLIFKAGFADNIYVGTSTALTGPAGFLGREMQLGMDAAFYEFNQAGHEHTINLIAMDDKYEPFYTELNTKRFANDDNFVAVLGNVGTPTARVALPITKKHNLPFIGAFTGSNLLRDDENDSHVINYRAGYGYEINNMIKGLFKAGISIDELAFFTQDDDYGDAGYLGVIKSLNLFNVDIKKVQAVPHGRYIRNTVYVEEGLKSILLTKRDIKAFIIVGTYQPVARFIKLAKEHYPSAYFFNVSFVGAEALKHELCIENKVLCREYTQNVVVTQVVPYLESKVPIIAEYERALKKYLSAGLNEQNHTLQTFEKKPNSISLEGYIVGKMFIHALKTVEGKVNRQSLLKAFHSLGDFDLGLGYKLNLSKDNNQASSSIFPISINNQQIGKFNWDYISSKEDFKSTWRNIQKDRK